MSEREEEQQRKHLAVKLDEKFERRIERTLEARVAREKAEMREATAHERKPKKEKKVKEDDWTVTRPLMHDLPTLSQRFFAEDDEDDDGLGDDFGDDGPLEDEKNEVGVEPPAEESEDCDDVESVLSNKESSESEESEDDLPVASYAGDETGITNLDNKADSLLRQLSLSWGKLIENVLPKSMHPARKVGSGWVVQQPADWPIKMLSGLLKLGQYKQHDEGMLRLESLVQNRIEKSKSKGPADQAPTYREIDTVINGLKKR